jgi:hypothetical protein
MGPALEEQGTTRPGAEEVHLSLEHMQKLGEPV